VCKQRQVFCILPGITAELTCPWE